VVRRRVKRIGVYRTRVEASVGQGEREER
jgi:hypothetical protein